MRKIMLAAGIALGLFALPLMASAQDAPTAPDAGAQTAPASGAAAAKPVHHKARKAHHARKHRHTGRHHAKKATAAAPAATDGGDATPATPQQ